MGKRVIRDMDFGKYVMIPSMYESVYGPKPLDWSDVPLDLQERVSTGDIVIRDRNASRYDGLGQVQSSGIDYSTWIMPVVIIVVSAMALMTVYAIVMSKR
jgi:hypothetical protein